MDQRSITTQPPNEKDENESESDQFDSSETEDEESSDESSGNIVDGEKLKHLKPTVATPIMKQKREFASTMSGSDSPKVQMNKKRKKIVRPISISSESEDGCYEKKTEQPSSVLEETEMSIEIMEAVDDNNQEKQKVSTSSKVDTENSFEKTNKDLPKEKSPSPTEKKEQSTSFETITKMSSSKKISPQKNKNDLTYIRMAQKSITTFFTPLPPKEKDENESKAESTTSESDRFDSSEIEDEKSSDEPLGNIVDAEKLKQFNPTIAVGIMKHIEEQNKKKQKAINKKREFASTMSGSDSPKVQMNKKRKEIVRPISISSESEDGCYEKKTEQPSSVLEETEMSIEIMEADDDNNQEKQKVSTSSKVDTENSFEKTNKDLPKKKSPSPTDKKEQSMFFETISKRSSPKKMSPQKNKDVLPKMKSSPKDKKATAMYNFFASEGSNKEPPKDGAEYNPSISEYHPIDSAIWKHSEKVPYIALARTLAEIENSSARLKMIEILSNFFRSVIILNPNDLLPSLYLCLNKLGPAYEGLEIGIAETNLIKTIAQLTGRIAAQIKADAQAAGDLGIVAERSHNNQRKLFQPACLTVRGVFDKLKEIANITSQTKKVEKMQPMFVACKHSEARFLIRSLAGKLTIGLTEQLVLQALALACATTPPTQSYPPENINMATEMSADSFKHKYDELALILKTTYCECPSYDMIIPAILKEGIEKLPEHCKLTPGIPLKPMLAHPTKDVLEVLQRFEGLKFTCEWMYDGERAQIHTSNDGKVNIYNKNQENNTSMYRNIVKRMNDCMDVAVESCILDCMVIARNKGAKDGKIKVHACVFIFDLLYLNGEPLVRKPFIERRALLKQNFSEIEGHIYFAKSLDTNTMEEIEEFLKESVKGNCEGLMVKTLEEDAIYEIASRSHNWLKLKKETISSEEVFN